MICFPTGARFTPCHTRLAHHLHARSTPCSLPVRHTPRRSTSPCSLSLLLERPLPHPLCLTSSTGLQAQLKCHSFRDNSPSYLLRSALDTPEPGFPCRPSMNSLSPPCPVPRLPPLPPARTHISIRAERMCTFLPRSGPQPPCPEPTCFVRLGESLRELKTCIRWLQTTERIY